MANARISLTYADYNSEQSSVSVRTGVPGPLATIADVQDVHEDFADAIDAVSIGLPTRRAFTYFEDKLTNPGEGASSNLAQREAKWLVRYYDSVTKDAGSFEIPAADLTLLNPANKDAMLIASGPGAALVTAVEATVLSKQGNAVVVVDVIHVGRNT